MAKLSQSFLLLGVVMAIWWTFYSRFPAKLPNLDLNEWWGPKELIGKVDNSIKPFKVKFDEAMVKDLKQRLKNHRPFRPPLEGVAFEYGFNSASLDSWLRYWADQYPFAERERFLNQFPQFKTNIQGLDVHFIRVKPQVPANVQVVPLLLMHGWPGSVRQFYEAIPLLTNQRPGYDFAFEVIVPSLPGYGFSDAPVRPGLSCPQMAVMMRNLMQKLGFKKYYIQGGNWGAVIASAMATLFPEEILGHHSNLLNVDNTSTMTKVFLGSFFPWLVVEHQLADRLYPLSKYVGFLLEESGYMHLQTTKPDTVGVALTDSPAGLLAYTLEKFSTWTMRGYKYLPDGGLEKKFSKEQLIDNVMIYWASNSITSSIRHYAEARSWKTRELGLDDFPTPVPTWGLQAKYEILYLPPNLLKTKFTNLLNTTVLDYGGHFAALEMPEIFVEDVFKAVEAFRAFNAKNMKIEL